VLVSPPHTPRLGAYTPKKGFVGVLRCSFIDEAAANLQPKRLMEGIVASATGKRPIPNFPNDSNEKESVNVQQSSERLGKLRRRNGESKPPNQERLRSLRPRAPQRKAQSTKEVVTQVSPEEEEQTEALRGVLGVTKNGDLAVKAGLSDIITEQGKYLDQETAYLPD
jgi:hypothetical protein